MKTNYTISVLFLLLFSVQLHSQCELPEEENITTLENEYRISHTKSGGTINSFQFESDYLNPLSPLINTFTYRGLWMGGLDPSGNLSLAISDYDINSKTDYQSGPILELNAADQEAFCEFYNRVWTVLDHQVVELQDAFIAGELSESDIPIDILQWPAKNNPHNGIFAVDYDMASFFDNNSDGNYNPVDGDYPVALKENPDFSAYAFNFTVYNDKTLHTLSRSNSIGMELHQIKYLTQCAATSELDKSIFHRINYIYKGNLMLNQFKIGLWEDPDLNCFRNDLAGCSEELNTIYVYASPDARLCDSEGTRINGYAIKSTVFLNQEIKSYISFFSRGFGLPPNQTENPSHPLEYYNLLSAKWRDGTSLTIGGTGYDSLGIGSVETNIAFTDFPNDVDGWSMLSNNVPYGDIKSLTTVYDSDMNPGQQGTIDFVDHITYNSEYDDEQMFEIYPEVINNLKEEYNTAIIGGLECNTAPCENNCVWPGDINDDNVVDGRDIILSGVYAGRDDVNGPARENPSIRWTGFTSDTWDAGLNLGNINAKYADVNGNGIIEYSDFYYTTYNNGNSHSNYMKENEELVDEGDINFKVRMDKQIIGYDTASFIDRLFSLELYVGERGQSLQEPLHGLSFEIQLDTNIIKGFGDLILVNEENEFQFNTNNSYEEFTETGLSVADDFGPITLSNYNGVNQNEGFKIFKHIYLIKDNLTTNNPDGRDTIKVKFYNVTGINAAGDIIDIGAIGDELIITNVEYQPITSSIESELELENNETIVLYPNPVDDILKIKSEESLEGIITVIDMYGKDIMTKRISASESNIDVTDICSGVYFMHYKSTQGTEYMSKFIKT